MTDIDLVAAVRAESARFRRVLDGTDLRARVPSCPDWTVADLVWHLTEVQELWANVAGELLADVDGMVRMERPDDAALLDAFEEQSARLLEAIATRAPEERCWSWSQHGGDVAWVRRRQAHEALIHRVDAELAVGAPIAEPTPALAADGVDELLTIMLADVPEHASFEPDGRALRLETTDAGAQRWSLVFGTLRVPNPRTGEPSDYDATALAPADPVPDVTVRAPAWHLDRWLWGRAGSEALEVDGDAGLAERLRQIAIETTQ